MLERVYEKEEEIFVRKAFKQGDSIAITIPVPIVKDLDLSEGDYVIVEKRGEVIILKKYFK